MVDQQFMLHLSTFGTRVKMASSLAMSLEERMQQLDRLQNLEKLKKADLIALCKEFKVKGYSKTKNADLVAKLLQYRASLAPDEASTARVVPQTPQPDHPQPATPSLPLTGALFATPATPAELLSSLNDGLATSTFGLPTFVDSPYSATSSNLLITPTAPPLRLGHHNGKGPGMNVQSSTAKSQTSSSSALHSSPLTALSTFYSRPNGSSTLTKEPAALGSPSTKIINRNRKEDRSQAATSLKDVVAKQREAKRTAREAGMANGNGTAKRVTTGHAIAAAAPSTTNALQLQDMFSPTLPSTLGLNNNNPSTDQANLSSTSTNTSGNRGSTVSASQSGSRAPLLMPPVSGKPATGPNNRLVQPNTSSLVVLPRGQSLTTPQNGIATHSKHTVSTTPSTNVTTSSKPTKPDRSRNSNMAPLKKSVVSTFARPTITATAPTTVPHLPPGTVPLASSPHLVPTKGRPMITEKKKLTRNFIAPARMPPTTTPQKQSEPVVPSSPCQEEPLLCGPVPETSSAEDINKLKQQAIARMRKSWLNRFYQQIAKARADTLPQDTSLAVGSRSPAGLPGMAAEFVFASATGPEQLDIATIFVIARLHTRIQMNDWESIVKDEQVISATKRAGGVWKISTRTQTQDLGRKFGHPSTAKAETETYFVVGDTGEVIGKGDDVTLRSDWQNLLSEGSNDGGKALIELLRTKDDLAYPRGIAAGWTKVAKKDGALLEEYRMAEKYVLSDVMPNSYSGEYQSALQMDATWTGQSLLSAQPRRARVNLYLPESHQVECVVFVTSSRTSSKPLHPSVMIVIRKSAEDFALRETGQIIGNSDDSGVTMVWQCLLGCDAAGVGVSEVEAKRISEQFWTGLEEE